MWCASSVSMNRQVRESGSKADSARESSWYLPSRSVNVVNIMNDSQSSIGSLKAWAWRDPPRPLAPVAPELGGQRVAHRPGVAPPLDVPREGFAKIVE